VWKWYVGFIRGVSVDGLGKTGVVLTTSAFVSFVIFEFTMLTGISSNAYAGLVSYLALPALFVVGLVLIFWAWMRQKRTTGLSTRELIERQFEQSATRMSFLGSRVMRTVMMFTLANVFFLSLASSRMLSFMDEPEFCGTACHSVMHPEWATYQDSPHARVACVDCHVGEGVDALVDSKLNGMWQMVSVTFGLYEQPIPTPVHQLRPARETCEKCHWPTKFYGSRVEQYVRYADDSVSTPSYTTLSLKVDTGKAATGGGIHWHVAEANEVRYASVDDKREEMIWVEARQADGSFIRYENQRLFHEHGDSEDIRSVDCVDCHNRATHVYEDPKLAVDERLLLGLLPGEIPFIKREAVTALTGSYADSVAAMVGIENQLIGFYRVNYPGVLVRQAELLDSAVNVLRDVYRRNVHHSMNVTWGAYPDFRGHDGCFRCHNENMLAEDGTPISHDCTMCHSIAAYDSETPFEFLLPPDTSSPTATMHQFLRKEYFESLNAAVGRQ